VVVCTIGANVVEVLIGEDVAVEGFVDPDPDPLQNPPLFSFKSTYSPSGIVSISTSMVPESEVTLKV